MRPFCFFMSLFAPKSPLVQLICDLNPVFLQPRWVFGPLFCLECYTSSQIRVYAKDNARASYVVVQVNPRWDWIINWNPMIVESCGNRNVLMLRWNRATSIDRNSRLRGDRSSRIIGGIGVTKVEIQSPEIDPDYRSFRIFIWAVISREEGRDQLLLRYSFFALARVMGEQNLKTDNVHFSDCSFLLSLFLRFVGMHLYCLAELFVPFTPEKRQNAL